MTTTEASTTAAGFDSGIQTSTDRIGSDVVTLSTSVFADAINLLSGNRSNNSEYSDSFNSTSNAGDGRGTLPQWQIILIASLCAAAVFIIVAMVLIWKLCGKKTSQDSSATIPSTKYGCRCCPGSSKGKKKSVTLAGNAATAPGSAQKQAISNDYQQNPSGLDKPLEPRAPLPPIGAAFPVDQNVVLQGATVIPRRLAPLAQPQSMATTSLAGGTVMQRRTGGVYAPIQQQQQIVHLKGVPMIPVPLEQRRPLPPPPPPPSN